ncbi:MAG: hypothetical protein HFH68_11220 [Lachnospiraceae bacterium]|nr:hypothetical protein [Lachnospiraceae bacterium]
MGEFFSFEQRMERYRSLLDVPEEMIFFFEPDGFVCERNHLVTSQLEYEEEEALFIQDIFRSVFELEDDRVKLAAKPERERFETAVYRKNQTCIPASAYICFLDEEETGCYGMCCARNIGKYKETAKDLISAKVEVEEVHKERNEFVANVTHELRTPVNGVMGLAQNLLATDLTSEQRESVDIIKQCCSNMIKIINNILDFSKLQSGKFTIEYNEFSFHQMMDKLVKVNMPQVESKGIKLICNVSADIPDRMIGDELRLTQVLNNLLSNAVKFTSVGQIVINVVKTIDLDEEFELFFMVIDTGIGIAEEEMDKLFRSFSQVDASITRRFGGTGLGLSIVKNLVEMMGGSVNVESEKGKGSTFSFSVRVKKTEPDTSSETDDIKESSYLFNLGDVSADEEEESELYILGSDENIKEINANMEKLIICIEMENWDRADAFADNIKQLVAEDTMNLKRKAFRLQMTVRKGAHEAAIEQYDELKRAIIEAFGEEEG